MPEQQNEREVLNQASELTPNISTVRSLESLELDSLVATAVPFAEIKRVGGYTEKNQQILEEFFQERGVNFEEKMEYAKTHYPGFLSRIDLPDDYANVAIREYLDSIADTPPVEDAECNKWIVENTDYISFEKFLGVTAEVVRSIESEIEQVGVGRDVVLCDNRGKSQGWLASIAWPLMSRPPESIQDVMQGHTEGVIDDTDDVAFNLSKEQLERSNIVIIDDGTYSGTQLSRNINDIYEKAKELGAQDVNLFVGVNFFTTAAIKTIETALEGLAREYPEFPQPKIFLGKQIKTCKEKCLEQQLPDDFSGKIYTLGCALGGLLKSQSKGIEDRALVTAAHKIPDEFSAFQVQKIRAVAGSRQNKRNKMVPVYENVINSVESPYKPINVLAAYIGKKDLVRLVDMLAKRPEIDLNKKGYKRDCSSKELLNTFKLVDFYGQNSNQGEAVDLPVILHDLGFISDDLHDIEVESVKHRLDRVVQDERYAKEAVPLVEQMITQRPDCLELVVSIAKDGGKLGECATVINKMTEEGREKVSQMILSSERLAPEVKAEISRVINGGASAEMAAMSRRSSPAREDRSQRQLMSDARKIGSRIRGGASISEAKLSSPRPVQKSASKSPER